MKRAIALAVIAACGKSEAPPPSPPAFWAYFTAHARQLHDEPLEAAMDELQRVVDQTHHGVLVELASDRSDRRLVLTADGDRAAFDDVRTLYASRPPNVPQWTIIAFRQRDPARPLAPIAFGSDAVLDPNSIRYMADRENGKLDLALFVPNYTAHAAHLVDIALDHVIGELDVDTKLGAISISTIEHAPAAAKPLVALAGDVDAP